MGGTSPADMRFRQLFDEHYRAIVAFFQRRIDPNDVHDAADDVFLVAWRRLNDVPLGGGAAVALRRRSQGCGEQAKERSEGRPTA